jgi:ribosomal protein S27E
MMKNKCDKMAEEKVMFEGNEKGDHLICEKCGSKDWQVTFVENDKKILIKCSKCSRVLIMELYGNATVSEGRMV